jgi:uncharacterized membrane protein
VKRETLIAGGVFLLIPIAILAAAVGCTWALAHGAPQILRLLFRPICHGIPSRCLTIWNTPMPICARCTAIYVGLFTGLLIFFVAPWINEKVARWILYVAAVPMGIDGVTQLLRFRESTNSLRIATGSVAGLAFGYWILSAIERRDRFVVVSRDDGEGSASPVRGSS